MLNVIGSIVLFIVLIYLIPTNGHNPIKKWWSGDA
jgi:hypothetical protein